MDSWANLKGVTLPPKNEFNSLLTESYVNEEGYKHAENIWSNLTFKH